MVLNAVLAWVQDAFRAPFMTAETIVTHSTRLSGQGGTQRITAEDKLAGSYWVWGFWATPETPSCHWLIIIVLLLVNTNMFAPLISSKVLDQSKSLW